MNEDDFENRLQALRPHALPEAWRAEILGRSRASARRSSLRPPRWLVAGWGLAWAAVIVLHLMTPGDPAGPATGSASAIGPALRERSQTMSALLAFNHDSTLPQP